MEERPKSWRTAVHVGAGMAVGAALGLLFGLTLLEDVIAGPIVGVVIGALTGLAWEMRGTRWPTYQQDGHAFVHCAGNWVMPR